MKSKRALITFFLAGTLLSVVTPALAGTPISPSCSRDAKPVGLPTDRPPSVKLVEADVSTDVARASLHLAYAVENGIPDPYVAVTGNFDGQGMSLGVMQFNFAGSAQETFRSVPAAVYDRSMPVWGKRFYEAVHSSAQIARRNVNLMQQRTGKNWKVMPDALSELKAFLGSPEAREAQDKAAAEQYRKGYSRAVQWASARGASEPRPREIASFVDNQIFSGGALGGIWMKQAKVFRGSFENDGEMVRFVSDWLASCPYKTTDPGFLYGANDAKTDSTTWKKKYPVGSKIPDDQALLFSFGFLRALTANGPPQNKGEPDQHGIFKAQVVERRGMAALGVGTANGVAWPGGVLDD